MSLRKWILTAVLVGILAGCDNRWSSGDRVLVSKCSYDNGFVGPNRYDVVVFKYPVGPVEKNTPKNYIKRLLGLPGELIAIFFGRLYRYAPTPGEAPPFDDSHQMDAKGQKTAIDPNTLWNKEYMHVDDETSAKWFEAGKFEILRKPPTVLMALRRIVYDNDYQAKELKGKADRWSPSATSSWKSQDTAFAFEGKAADVDWLHYQHLVHDWKEPLHGGIKIKPQLINNAMDYNSFNLDDPDRQRYHWVGDLMLECNVDIAEPKGEFLLEVSKGNHRYQARWDLSTGQCTLFQIGLDGKKELDSRPTSVKSAGSYMLRLANVDARMTVWVDGALPFGDGKEYAPPELQKPGKAGGKEKALLDFGPTKENDLDRPASIGAKDARVKVSHVRLWRDTYYITRIGNFGNNTDYESLEAMPNRDPNGESAWADPTRWEPIRKQRFSTMYVQPGHYLCLGDNSQASSDSRDWGLVPARLMLGRALVVYFPLERMGPIR